MKYKNMKTGVVIDSPCVLRGGDWQDYTGQKLEAKKKEATQAVEVVENEIDEVPEEITKNEIMQELDAFGVEYNPRAKKQELYDLMISQGKE